MTRPPLISLLGASVAVVGVALDFAVHLALRADGHDHVHVGFTASEHIAHLVVLLGMVLIWTGVVIDGARRQLSRRPSPARLERSVRHAIR